MRRTYTIYGGEKCIQDSVKKYERDHLEYLGVNGRTIFNSNSLQFYFNIIA